MNNIHSLNFFLKFGDRNAILSYAGPLDSSSNQLATGAIVECQHHGSRPETSSLTLLLLAVKQPKPASTDSGMHQKESSSNKSCLKMPDSLLIVYAE